MIALRFDSLRLRVVCIALMAAYPALASAGVAGRAQFVAGDVRIVDAQGNEHPLRKGQDVNEGDTVKSAPGASAQLKMIDGALLAVRPDTQLKVVGYAFNGKQDGSESASFSLVKGGLRAITGLIGKVHKDKVKIEAPTAVIGIRGTDHEPVVVLPAAAGLQAIPPGTYDKVNVGATALSNQAGTTVVAANQVGFAASATQQPVILPKVPDFYRATPAPKQGQKQEQKQEQKQAQNAGQQDSEPAGSSDGTHTDSKADSATNTATATAASLTATDASGNTLNLSNQTLTTASGQLLSLSTASSGSLAQAAAAYSELIATYPAPAPTDPAAPQPPQPVYYPAMYFFGGPSRMVARDAAGNVTGVTAADTFRSGYHSSLSQSGSTLSDLGRDTASGLSWGRWQGGQVTQSNQWTGMDANGNRGFGATDASGAFVIGATQTSNAALGSASLHWIAGSAAAPGYLPQVLTGSANYSLIGATRPTDVSGNVGTLNRAALTANFSSQMVSANLNFSIGGNVWNMQSDAMPLQDSHFSSRFTCGGSCTSSVVLTKNGAAVSASGAPTTGFSLGSMNGVLTGPGLNGAGLQYAVHDAIPVTQVDSASGQTYTTFTNNLIQGVAAFSGPAQDIQTPFRPVGIADGWGNGMDAFSFKDASSLTASSLYRGSIDAGESPAARVIDSAAGMTEFVGRALAYTPLNATAVQVSPLDGGTPATVKIGSAVNRDVGALTIDGATVSWGRWEGGSVDIYSRDGALKLGTIDNSGRSMHWVNSSALTSASTFSNLPLTGSATYVVAGSTSPTDLLGNVGKLTSATLSADFANARANAAIGVGFNTPGNTSSWNMSANNIPLDGKNGFESNTMLNGVNGITHTASCSGTSCGAQTIGQINGVFFGGAQGAVLMYGMASGATSAVTTTSPPSFNPSNAVSGVVVMKR